MLPLGLTAANLALFHATLATHHSIKVSVSVLTMDGDHVSTLDQASLDGQVNVDKGAEVTRSATLSVLDPGRSLTFDSDSPADGALYLDRMVRVVYAVNVTTLGWVEVPVFTGPVTKVDRADDVVNIECQGKESIGLGAAWRPMTLKKGHNKVGAIRTILRDRAGENRFDLPELTARLSGPVSLSRQTQPWMVASKIAHSMNRQLFYDGAGVCRLRRYPGAVFTFSAGDGGLLAAPPQVSFDTERVRNVVWVKGGKPRGVQTDNDPTSAAPKNVPDISYFEIAPASHPLSPQRLGRNGTPRYLVEVVENSKIRSKAEAKRLAKRRLADLLREAVDVTFESLPVPHLEPGDLVSVTTPQGTVGTRLSTFSLPLSVGSTMSVGFHKKVSVSRRNRR